MMNSTKSNILTSKFAYSRGSEMKPLENFVGYYIEADITDATPAAKAFATTDVDTSTETISETSHGFITGNIGQFTTTDTLPAGLSLSTDYFVIKVDDDSYKVATSLANAKAGTAVNITDQGVGTHTFTPTSLTSASIKLQGTAVDQPTENDWQDIADSSVNVTATGKKAFNVSGTYYSRVRYYITLSGGQLDISAIFVGKGA